LRQDFTWLGQVDPGEFARLRYQDEKEAVVTADAKSERDFALSGATDCGRSLARAGKVFFLPAGTQALVLEYRQLTPDTYRILSARLLLLDGPLAGCVVWAETRWVSPLVPPPRHETEAYVYFARAYAFDRNAREAFASLWYADAVKYRERCDDFCRMAIKESPKSKWADRARLLLKGWRPGR
jgi:hypothetical protein